MCNLNHKISQFLFDKNNQTNQFKHISCMFIVWYRHATFSLVDDFTETLWSLPQTFIHIKLYLRIHYVHSLVPRTCWWRNFCTPSTTFIFRYNVKYCYINLVFLHRVRPLNFSLHQVTYTVTTEVLFTSAISQGRKYTGTVKDQGSETYELFGINNVWSYRCISIKSTCNQLVIDFL